MAAKQLSVEDALMMIEGYRNAVRMQRDAFGNQGIPMLCHTPPVDARVISALQGLKNEAAAFATDVELSLNASLA